MKVENFRLRPQSMHLIKKDFSVVHRGFSKKTTKFYFEKFKAFCCGQSPFLIACKELG
jgi:hypothetical protein